MNANNISDASDRTLLDTGNTVSNWAAGIGSVVRAFTGNQTEAPRVVAPQPTQTNRNTAMILAGIGIVIVLAIVFVFKRGR